MSVKKEIEKEIREAVVFLREHNQTISSETIEFMKVASLEKLNHPDQEIKTYCFDCWDRKGKMDTKYIKAISEEQATIVFEHDNPDLGFDEPYT